MPDKKIVQPLDIKDEARPHSKTGGDIEWKQPHPFPPADESMQQLAENGTITFGQNGEVIAHDKRVHYPQGGWIELKELMNSIWPDMPPGTSFQQVLDRAKELRGLLDHPAIISHLR